jgi:hypothetical protein
MEKKEMEFWNIGELKCWMLSWKIGIMIAATLELKKLTVNLTFPICTLQFPFTKAN